MITSTEARAHSSSEMDQLPSSSTTSSKRAPNTYKEELKTLILFYTNPMYVVVSIGVSVYQFILIIVLSVVVDYALDKGMPSTCGKYLIYGISIGDLLGRLCFGWVTDKGFLSLANFSMCLFIIQGIFLELFPIITSFADFTIILFMYGMSSGSIIVLFPVIIHKYVPRNVQILAIGGLSFMSGILSLFIPLVIGHFRDNLGSYDKMFYLLGGISAATGFLYSCEPLVVKWYYSEHSVCKILNKGSVNA